MKTRTASTSGAPQSPTSPSDERRPARYGIHECIAQGLSLAELEEGFRGLLARLPGLRLTVPPPELRWTDPTRDMGLEALMVEW